jgi:Mg-chelatase subunit ChlD
MLEKAATPREMIDKIKKVLEAEKGKGVDIVLCLDTTGSMKDDIDAVREMLIPMLQNILGEFSSFRIGMVLYKDYYEEYITRVIPFTRDFSVFQRTLNGIRTGGGRDIPEAVYEALYDGAVKFTWEAESKLIILIGDAPPHPRQMGEVSEEMVNQAVAERGIRVNAIILPQ